jgi:hypothetical protein
LSAKDISEFGDGEGLLKTIDFVMNMIRIANLNKFMVNKFYSTQIKMHSGITN